MPAGRHDDVMASFAGTAIVRLHQLLTALFVITALYAAIVFALELDPGIEAAVLGAIFGLEWAGNLREIHPNQTDFRQAGWTFTLLFLPSAILLSYGTAITMLLGGGVAPGWSFAKSGATGMLQDSWTCLELGIQQLRDLLPE